MVKVIMGLKGSGKTKQLVKDINEAVQSETGSVVCVEFGKKLTYDIDYRVRLIDAKEYNITDVPLLKGFLSGLHAGNFDITHVFIESLNKLVPTVGNDDVEPFLDWLESFSQKSGIKYTISISEDASKASDGVKKYF